ncbi:MAG TPA: carbohydrate porin [Polyangiaceae bacterium]|nr:carbohydrate porin [Polyangiaceae bacterium]
MRALSDAPIRSVSARGALALVALATLLVARSASAEVAEPSGRSEQAFDFMNLLAHHGLHDLADEDWNAYGQVTDIWTWKSGFHAAYTNCAPTSVTGCSGTGNSLSSTPEMSFTETATLFAGMRLWPGAEAYFVPEVIAEKELSHLHGLGGAIQDFELQKQGPVTTTPYLSRAYITQTIELGGHRIDKESNPMQLARVDRSRRLVFTVGNFSVLDFFDQNNVSGDLRRSFFNMAFLTYAAYDFAADARGYAWGGLAELDYDDWTLRAARMTPPKVPNGLPLDFRIGHVYGDQVEVEHAHHLFGGDGAVRVLGYRNVEYMGKFSDAIAAFEADPAKNAANCGNPPNDLFNYGSSNAQAPDLCWVRGNTNTKLGIGFSVEQQLFGDVGVFFRGMYSDGKTEVYSFTSTDRSISFGAVARGDPWHRVGDTVGVGWSQGWISQSHAQYLAMGGEDGFIGDGRLNQASEGVFEVFYSLSLGSSAWTSLDYQFIRNPAYNADRGPVNIIGARIHVEF